MFRKQYKTLLFFMFCNFCCNAVLSQTIVKGTVFDNKTGEPMPFVNVVFQHSTVGTITDINGAYYIKTSHATDTIIATSLGYDIQKFAVKKNFFQEINFQLNTSSLQIEEIVVKRGENPAFAILEKIYANKKKNNPDRFNAVQYRTYNKFRLDLNNIDQAFKDQRILKQFQFVFDHMDSSEVFSKNYLPLLISESVSQFYMQKSPPVEKEVIEAFKISGIENNTLSQYTGKMYQRLNVYDNFMTLFEPGFVSPIADFGKMYYKYYLEDSAFVGDSWCYKIAFKPKRTQERTFYGYFWVADTAWAIKKIQLRVSSDVNINFMNDLIAVNEYKKINDSIWFLSYEDLLIDFNINDKSYGFFGHKEASYSDIAINQPVSDEIKKLKTNTYIVEDNLNRDDQYWESNRSEQLSEQEKKVYIMVDSIKEVPMYKTVYGLIEMMFDYYYVKGPVEIGPYYTFYSANPIEGQRVKFGLRTSNEFSTKYRFGGHLAYGFGDDKFKYGLTTDIMFDRDPRRMLKLKYLNDMRQLGKSENALTDDNILTTILRRRPNYKLTLIEHYGAEYIHEWFQGFSNSIYLARSTMFATTYVPLVVIEEGGILNPRSSITTNEITFKTHFAYKEKFLLGKYERVSLGSIYPAIDFDITYSPKNFLDNDYDYIRLKFQLYDRLDLNPFGFTRYWITAGKTFGRVPYPMLELHEGNETYAYDVYAFNMMNYYEFASDEYVSLFAEQHLQGFFLNKIPLLKRLEWREVASAKVLVGRMSHENRYNVMEFPEGLNPLSKPYIEAGLGLENILRLIRVEALWRLSYLDNPDIQIFGARVLLQLTF